MNSIEYTLLPRIAELCAIIHNDSHEGYMHFEITCNVCMTYELVFARFGAINYIFTNNDTLTNINVYRRAKLQEALDVLELIAHHGIRKPHEYADYLSSLEGAAA